MAEEFLVAELRIAHDRMRQDMQRAAADARAGSRDIVNALNSMHDSVKNLPQAFSDLNKKIKETEQAAKSTGSQVSRFSGFMNSLKGTLAALGLIHTTREIIQFTAAMSQAGETLLSVEARLRVATGSAKEAADAMAFVREESSRLAQNTLEGAKSFSQLAIAAKDTALEGQGVEFIFSALNETFAALNLDAGAAQRTMNQVVQVMNKGKITAEEMITISENGIPIQKMLKEALARTGIEYKKAMEGGKLPAEALLLIAVELREAFGKIADEAAQRVPAQFRRMKDQVTLEFADMFAALYESKNLMLATGTLINGGDIFPSREEMTRRIDEFVAHFVTLVSIVSILLSAMRKNFMQELSKMKDAIVKFLAPIDNWIKTQFDKIPLPQWLENFGQSIKGFLDAAGGAVDETKKKIDEMSSIELLFNKEDSLASLKEIEKRLSEALGIKGIDLLDPKKMEEAAKKSGKAMTKELEEAYNKIRDKINKDINAPSDAEMKKAAKKLVDDAAHAREEIRKMRNKILNEEIEEELKAREKLQKDIAEIARRAEEDHKKRVVGDASTMADAHVKAWKEAMAPMETTFENMNENIQDAIGNSLTDAFTGQLDSIAEVGKEIVKIFARTGAELLTALAVKPMIDNLVNTLKDSILPKLDSWVSSINIPIPGTGGASVTGRQALGVAAGLGAGLSTGMGVNQMVGGGVGGGIAGGAVGGGIAGGAIAGAIWGSNVAPMTMGISIAVGAVVGALAGLTAALLSAEEKIEIGIRTGVADPNNTQFGHTVRGPFGDISLADTTSNTSPSDTVTVATIIAEADAALASLMSQRQRDIVTTALQGQPFNLDAKEMDDAVAQAIQTRLYIALAALTDQATAINIVGDPYTGTAENIDTIQRRAAEAIAILQMLEEFQIGPLSDAAQAIKNINDQFTDLIDRANMLGLDQAAADLAAEQARQLAEFTADFNQGIADQILAITDPIAAEWAALERQQAERVQNAIDAGADMVEVERLNALEREALAERLGQANDAVNASLEEQARVLESIANFAAGSLSGTSQQIRSLDQTFSELIDEAMRTGVATDELRRSFEEQRAEIIRSAQVNAQLAIAAIVNPFMAAMLSIEQQLIELQKLANEGIIDQGTVDEFRRVAEEQARYNEALRIASGSSTLAIDQFNAQVQAFTNTDFNLSEAQQRIQAINDEAARLIAALNFLGLDTSGVEAARAERVAQVEREEAERQREEQRAEAERRRAERERRREEREAAKRSVASFIGAGDSSVQQQLDSLQQSFRDVQEQAREAGVSVRGLSKAYHEQRNEIIRLAQENVASAIYAITNPFAAAMLQIAQQVREFKKLADDGIISKQTVREFERLAIEQARYNEATRIAGGAQTSRQAFDSQVQDYISVGRGVSSLGQEMRDLHENSYNLQLALSFLGQSVAGVQQSLAQQANRIVETAYGQLHSVIEQFGDPLGLAIREANVQIEELRQLARDGLVAGWYAEYAARLIEADVLAQEAMRRIGGGPTSAIGQVADAFDQFIRAGNPLSQTGQKLYDLTENFINLADAANLLGYSTAELEESYLSQAKAIREESVRAIDEYLASLRMSDAQPYNLRFDEAQAQFRAATAGSDIDEMIRTADQLRNISRDMFGSGAEFWNVERDIVTALEGARAKELAATDMELQQLQIGRSSLDHLQRIEGFNSRSAQAQEEAITLARRAEQREERTAAMLERIMAQMRA